MALVQIVKRTGEINRVKPDRVPVVEFDLREDQRVISIELDERPDWGSNERKTKDWKWTAYIETGPA